MNYSITWLLDQLTQGHRVKYLFFWGNQPSKSGEVTKSCFSQWWLAEVEVAGITYRSTEHWMMAEKARLFHDTQLLARILAAPSPAEAKKLGRQIAGFVPQVWDEHKYNIVKAGNLHKFSQHPNLKAFLLATHDRVLVEASPVDSIWGIGLAADAPDAEHPERWQGENLLGFALMEVRDQLRNA
ncbi:NADAR family protein [Hymenobacter taeanensis]|uniref:NADAR family protein n=1 Tax=Hymenobacter taeanensis TaxID=2735321 RepID=A0A6M6BEU9_9BACT|nr:MULTISPECIES: NADAR family protein [Hymenobacter]QJX45743.1 NADAR family protein [Hymenobacter taeanensis]UOQ79583.1 NADAR family protein [Hymenobacter sp. 5414T-23]